jgi:hypothetical protein
MNWFKKLSSYDHRKAPRLKLPLLVAYYWDGAAPAPHEVQNISSTGFYLLTEERWQPGTIVTMTLQRTSTAHGNPSAEQHIAVMAKVVRLGEDGVGFAFMPLELETDGLKSRPAGKKAIGKLLEHLKSDRGHAILEHIEAILKRKWMKQNSGSVIPGDRWRERYEETEG